jgi:hypothetical protein
LDRFLPLWIAVAMAAGLAFGAIIPGLDDALDSLRIGTVSLPLAIGLLLMMYPCWPRSATRSWAPSRDIPDPKGRPIEEVRATRDEIAGRVRQLLDEL